MSRYIDIDDISLRKTVAVGGLSAKALWRRIQQAPSIDIVRCKSCKHWNTKGCRDGVGECEWAYYMTKPDDFCSYGERGE